MSPSGSVAWEELCWRIYCVTQKMFNFYADLNIQTWGSSGHTLELELKQMCAGVDARAFQFPTFVACSCTRCHEDSRIHFERAS